MKKWINSFWKKNFLSIIGIVLGAIGGFLYWHFVGCTSGHCPITGSPVYSTLYGGILGWLLFSMFKPKSKNKKENS